MDVNARYFTEISSPEMLQALIQSPQWKDMPKLILGGGSNILLLDHFKGLVIKNAIRGIKTIKEDKHHAWLKIGAGENWHDFVLHCVKQNLGGVEKLFLNPGNRWSRAYSKYWSIWS